MASGRKGFALLPILIILASVLIGTGSVLLLREKMNEEQGTRDKEQEGISKFQETNDPPTGRAGKQTANSNESNSLKQSNDETSAENLTLKSSNENNTNDNISYDETNSSESQEIISKQIASSNDVNNDSLYLKADNDGKDKLHLGNTLKIKGGDGIKTSLSNNTITITNTGNTSPSSTVTVTESNDYDFDADQFSVSDNAVSIKDIYVKRTDSILIPGSNISLLTNDSGYITDGNTNWDNSYGYITASSSDNLTNKTGNISQWTNDSAYIIDGNTNWDNSYGFITDGNTGWDNSYNFITASSSDALTNKTGNISMWTNDANFITLSSLSSSATGLTYTNTTGAFSLTSGYVIPTTTQETNWGTAYSKTHDQNTDTGTTNATYQIDSDATGPKLKNNATTLEVRNAGDTDYANLKVKDLDIEGVLQAGTSNIQLTDTTGKIQALSSTYFASLSGSNLTSLNASSLSTGTVPSSTVTGSYTGITGVGTITTGTWSGTEIGVTKGGTGLTTISSGKLLYSSALNTLSELTLDTTLEISAGYLGVNETNILLNLLGGTLDDSQLPSGGDWTLTTNLNIDSNTLYINQSTNSIGIGTTNPNSTLDVNGTVRAQTICDENGANCRDLSGDWSPTTCPTGYILVPGSTEFGTKDFCVMKYEAKQDGTTKSAVSTPTGSPWVSISQYYAKTACERAGAHLITNAEWMTIARNIEATTINDSDDDAGLQLPNGHSDNAPASALASTSGADPVVSGCTTTQTMENVANAYSAGSCEIRGTGSGGSTDNDKGYYGTGQQWSTTGYSAGTANKSQLRTHVLSNKQVIWDFSGNVWEWTDNLCGVPWYTTGWVEWNNANVTDQEKYDAGPSGSLTSANGAGQYYGCSANGNAFVRGGFWDNAVSAGVFAVYLYRAPSVSYTDFGFRCVLPK